MEIKLTSSYYRSLRQFVKHNKLNASNLKKALKLFKENPRYPSLHLEKLGGANLWTIRIDQGNRIYFVWIDKQTTLFIDIGPHDKYRKY